MQKKYNGAIMFNRNGTQQTNIFFYFKFGNKN